MKPAFIIEVGTSAGGTSLFLADTMTAIGDGIVITIDIHDPRLPQLDNLHFLYGSSTYPALFDKVSALADGRRGLVLLDGDHSEAQVLRELELYSDLADYLVVQDTIMEYLDMPDNPLGALEKWYPAHSEFAQDEIQIDVTQHPGGWLKRRGA